MLRLSLALVGTVAAGAPMVFFAWHEVSEALLGRPHAGRLAAAAVVLAVLAAVLVRFRRFLLSLEPAERSGLRCAADGRTTVPGELG